VWQKKTPAEQAGQLRHLRDEHLPAEAIGKLAAEANVKMVVMTHLVTTVEPDDDYQRYVDAARKYYAGPIYIAKDLQRF
jgi:ribonuclease BN (tRNA processing enzyme)